jgi:predicted CXXCH cytochrome family protein
MNNAGNNLPNLRLIAESVNMREAGGQMQTTNEVCETAALFTTKPSLLRLVIIIYLLLISPLVRSQAAAEKAPLLWIKARHYTYILNTPAPIKAFSFIINKQKVDLSQIKTAKYKTTLHAIIPLHEGKNRLIIKLGDKIIQQTYIFSSSSFESGKVPDEAIEFFFHRADREISCRPCHRLDAKRADVRPKNIKKQICYPCHKHEFDGVKYRHKPAITEWRCLICHQYQFVETDTSPDQPIKFTVNQENGVAYLCFRCHRRQQQQIKGYNYVHGPIGMGSCNLCHNPHGSNFKYFLQDKITTLCVNCHEMQDTLTAPVLHQVIKTKGCTVCHDPHGSMYQYQLIAGLNKLCYKCHPDIYRLRHNHPLQGHPVAGPSNPAAKDEKFTCVSCHSPHSSDYANLLPVADAMELCGNCHHNK